MSLTKSIKTHLFSEESKLVNLYQGLRTASNDVGLVFPDEVNDDYKEWFQGFSEDEVKQAANKMQSLLMGKVSHLPQVCPGADSCIYKHTCPFKPKEPRGLQCPVESGFVIKQLNNLHLELAVDSFKETDIIMVTRLLELELMDMRLSAKMMLPEYQQPLLEVTTGSTMEGELIKQEQANPLWEMKETINREKRAILKVLVETPEARYIKQVAMKEQSKSKYDDQLNRMEELLKRAEQKLLN